MADKFSFDLRRIKKNSFFWLWCVTWTIGRNGTVNLILRRTRVLGVSSYILTTSGNYIYYLTLLGLFLEKKNLLASKIISSSHISIGIGLCDRRFPSSGGAIDPHNKWVRTFKRAVQPPIQGSSCAFAKKVIFRSHALARWIGPMASSYSPASDLSPLSDTAPAFEDDYLAYYSYNNPDLMSYTKK